MIREADVIPNDLYYLGLFHLNLTSIGKSHEICKQKPVSLVLIRHKGVPHHGLSVSGKRLFNRYPFLKH
jgi:hypothetical protein